MSHQRGKTPQSNRATPQPLQAKNFTRHPTPSSLDNAKKHSHLPVQYVTPEEVAQHAERVCLSPSDFLDTHNHQHQKKAGGGVSWQTSSSLPTVATSQDRGGATTLAIPSCYHTNSTSTSVHASPTHNNNNNNTTSRNARGSGGDAASVATVAPYGGRTATLSPGPRSTSPPHNSTTLAAMAPVGKLGASIDTNRRLAAMCHTLKQVGEVRAGAALPSSSTATSILRPLSSTGQVAKRMGFQNHAMNLGGGGGGGEATVSPLSDRSLSPLSWAEDAGGALDPTLSHDGLLLGNSVYQSHTNTSVLSQAAMWSSTVGLVRQRRAEQDEAKMMQRLTTFLVNDEKRCCAKSVFLEKMLDERRVIWSKVFVHASFVAMLAHHVTLRRAYDVLKQKFLYRYLRFVRKKRSTRQRAQRLKERETLMTAPPSAEVLCAQIPIFQKLPEDTVAALRAAMTKRCIFTGEFLAYEGEPGDGIAVLHQGALTVSRKSTAAPTTATGATMPPANVALTQQSASSAQQSAGGGVGGKLMLMSAAAAKLNTVVIELINGSACPMARPPPTKGAPSSALSGSAAPQSEKNDSSSSDASKAANNNAPSPGAVTASAGGRVSLNSFPAKRSASSLGGGGGGGLSSSLNNSSNLRQFAGGSAAANSVSVMTTHQTILTPDKANTYGWAIGQTMLFTAEPYDASFRAAVDVDLWVLSGAQFIDIVVKTMKGVATRQLEYVNRLIDERRASNMSQHRRMTEQAVRASSPLFQYLSSSGIARLIRCLRPQVVRRGDVVVEPGKYGTQVVFVVAGRVEVFYGPSAGVSIPPGYMAAAGQSIGNTASLGGAPASPSAADKKTATEVFRVGSSAGEVASYLGKVDPKSYIRAAANAELWMLDATDLQSVLIHEESRAVMVSVLTLLDENGNEKIFRPRGTAPGAAAGATDGAT